MNPLVDSVHPDRWKKNVKLSLIIFATTLSSVLLLGIPILAIDLHRQKLTVPVFSRFYASVTAKLLPVNIVSES